MSDISWIKLYTDMFDNPKVKAIRRMPEGNNIILIWVMLLTMAGRCNADGNIFLTKDIGYNIETLSDELRFSSSVVQLALSVLSQYGMILCDETTFYIKNWEEYQNVEGMAKAREQTRRRVAAYRERQKLLESPKCNATCNATVTLHVTESNATEEDIEEELEKDVEEEIVKPKRKKQKFIPPTLEEIRNYVAERNSNVDPDRFYDYYTTAGWIDANGNQVRNWKAKLITWESKQRTVAKRTNVADDQAFIATAKAFVAEWSDK